MERRLTSLASRWLLITGVAWCHLHGAGGVSANESSPLIDPEVREATTRGPTPVLVELRMPPRSDPSSSLGSAIALAQREVLSRLPPSHFSVVRRFETVPFLALEIDAGALRALENMGDLVTRIVPDRPLAPARP
jgi:hypothetical protein